MINRTLIRLKVVQMLYAHLLTRADFKTVKEPGRKTVEARQSFDVYCKVMATLLVLTAQNGLPGSLADIRNRNVRTAIMRNDKMLMALAADNDLRETLQKNIDEAQLLQSTLEALSAEIQASSIYRDFSRKRKIEIEENIRFWCAIIKTVIEPRYLQESKESGNVSQKAVVNGCDMAVETLQNYGSVRTTLLEARQALDASLRKAYELYISLLVLAVELTKERERQIDAAKNKYIPTHEELNPNTRFIDNRLIKEIAANETIQKFIKDHPVDWDTDPVFLKNLLADILASKSYNDYMQLPEATFADDCELWRRLFQDVIFPSDALAEEMENKSVYWNDDLHIMGTFVVKSIKKAAKADDSEPLFEPLPMYKDEEDSRFGAELFMKAVDHHEEYREYIDRFLKDNWDPDRIAFMDVVVMIAAIAELINFPNIPLPVTMNEYTDIAADYSTNRSGQFVNGLLYSVAQELKREGRIFKQ